MLSLSIKRRRNGASYGLLRLVFFSGLESPMSEIKKQGVFRASKVGFDSGLIRGLVLELLNCGELSQEDLSYLKNINNLLLLAPEVLYKKNQILNEARSRKFFFKSMLAFGEIKFNELAEGQGDDVGEFIDRIFFKNKETLISAISYVVQLFRESIGCVALVDSNEIDGTLGQEYYFSLLEKAFAIQNYLEVEVGLDFFGHDVLVGSSGNDFYIHNEIFETAKSHGYTKTYLRAQSQVNIYSERIDSSSFVEFLNEFWLRDSQENHSLLYELKLEPAERVVLTNVAGLLSYGVNFFGQDRIFHEEQIQLMTLADENYNEDILKINICGSLNCFDILKIQRFFKYLSFIYRKACEKIADSGNAGAETIRKRSVLPVMDKDDLIKIFHTITKKNSSDCEVLVDKLTNATIAPDEVIDLQYKPMVKIGHRYLMIPSLFAYSNIVRSLAKDARVHLSAFDGKDYMIDSLCSSLIQKGLFVKRDFQFGDDEVDVVAIFGEDLFLFECKNPCHPVNDFELRNTYAHLEKGFDQIEKFKRRFENNLVLRQFLKNLGIANKNIKKVHYGIVNANRALTGLERGGVRVIHANELVSFVSSGLITSLGQKLHTWASEEFSVEDLISYIQGNVLSNDLIRHKSPVSFSIRLENKAVHFNTFEYDLTSTHEFQLKAYRSM